MIILIESIVLCLAFTLMVFIMSRKPIQAEIGFDLYYYDGDE